MNKFDWLDWVLFGVSIWLALGAIGCWLNGLMVKQNNNGKVWEQYGAAATLATLAAWIMQTLFN